MTRRNNDFYETHEEAVGALRRHADISRSDVVFEPCAGRNAITRALVPHVRGVVTNDIVRYQDIEHNYYFDATDGRAWRKYVTYENRPDYIVTNPPFAFAYPILLHALKAARKGVALLLRLSFLEPTRDREAFLVQNPPARLIVLPRYSFTGDGKTDSVTCAWMVWYVDGEYRRLSQRIVIEPKFGNVSDRSMLHG